MVFTSVMLTLPPPRDAAAWAAARGDAVAATAPPALKSCRACRRFILIDFTTRSEAPMIARGFQSRAAPLAILFGPSELALKNALCAFNQFVRSVASRESPSPGAQRPGGRSVPGSEGQFEAVGRASQRHLRPLTQCRETHLSRDRTAGRFNASSHFKVSAGSEELVHRFSI